jgi:hypothetical protein
MNEDTINLLKECNSGIKMGIESIDNVMPYVKSDALRSVLNACKDKHAVLGDEARKALINADESTKNAHPVAQVMSDMKIRATVTLKKSDNTVADVMTDGCNMGIKSIYKYLNQYASADDKSRSIANRLISAEQELRTDLRSYL